MPDVGLEIYLVAGIHLTLVEAIPFVPTLLGHWHPTAQLILNYFLLSFHIFLS